MNPATFVVGAIVGAATTAAWGLAVAHPPHAHSWWNVAILVAVFGSIALAIGVVAALADGVQRG